MTVKMLDKMTLEELTDTYLCNKYGKDPIKCLDCEKHEGCVAGRRAIEILNEMTEARKLSKWDKARLVRVDKARRRAVEVMKHEDPLKYLMEVEGVNIRAARERIRKYKMKYPDLFKAEDLVVQKRNTRKKEEETSRKADYIEAAASENPIGFYMNKYGLKRDTAWHRWVYAKKQFEKIVQEEKNMANETEEEISLEDFLNQHKTDEKEVINEEGKTFEPELDKIEDTYYSERKDAMEKDGPKDALHTKYEALILEREELLAKVEQYNEIIHSFEIVMDALKDYEA